MNSFLIKQQIFCVLNKSRELFIFTIFLFKFNTNCEFFIDTAKYHSYEIINTKKRIILMRFLGGWRLLRGKISKTYFAYTAYFEALKREIWSSSIDNY